MKIELPKINDSPRLHERDGFYSFVYNWLVRYIESGGTILEYKKFISELLPSTKEVFVKALCDIIEC